MRPLSGCVRRISLRNGFHLHGLDMALGNCAHPGVLLVSPRHVGTGFVLEGAVEYSLLNGIFR